MPVHETYKKHTKLFRRTMWNKSCTTKHGSSHKDRSSDREGEREGMKKRSLKSQEHIWTRRTWANRWTARNAIMEKYWQSVNAVRGIWNCRLERVQTLNILISLTSMRNVLCWWSIDAVALEWSRRCCPLSFYRRLSTILSGFLFIMVRVGFVLGSQKCSV